MAMSKRMLTDAGVTLETLEETPMRVTQFLLALATRPLARRLLERRGYDKREHQRGWRLLEKAGSYESDEAITDLEVRDAIAEADRWDEPGIRIIRAAFTRHPDARAAVLKGIEPVAGPAAVLNVAKLLERLNALEKTKEGQAALATLAERGIDAAERGRMAALVKIAKRGTQPQPVDESDESKQEAYMQTLVELRDWYTEWAEVARINITRRDYLIALGLAERRSPGGGGGGGGGGGADDGDVVVDPAPFLPDPNDPGTT